MRRGIYHENPNSFTPADHPNQYFEKQLCCIKNKKYHNKVLMGKFHWNAWSNDRILPQRPESKCIVLKDNNKIDCFVYGSASNNGL